MKLNQYRNPAELAIALRARTPEHRRVIGIDLGTNCGVAWADIMPGGLLEDATIFAGQLDLSLEPYDTGPLRFIRLKQFLQVLAPDIIGFEDVKFTPSDVDGGPVGVVMARVSKAAELLGGLKVLMTTWAEENHVPVQSLGIGQIKKYATGKGNANKVEMIKAASAKYHVQLDHVDYDKTGVDNLADAMHICAMIIEMYADGL